MRSSSTILAASVLAGACALAADLYRVRQAEEKVYKGPVAYFGVLTSVPQGTEMELLGSRGRWRQVRTPDGATGWVLPPESVELPAGEVDASYLGATQAAAIGAGLVTKGFAKGYPRKHGVRDVEDTQAELERVRFNAEDLDGFVDQGGLQGTGGGR